MRVTLGHGPDLGDALLFEALTSGTLDTRGLDFDPIAADIHRLNELALEHSLDVTTVSLATYPLVQDEYTLLGYGAGMAGPDGPVVVSRRPLDLDALRSTEIAVPATVTTGFLLLRMAFGGEPLHRIAAPEEILGLVTAGEAVAGLLRHEGEPTLQDLGLVSSLDLAEWWLLETGLPLPLRVLVARRGIATAVSDLLRDAIEEGLERRAELANGCVACDDADEARQAVTELLRRAEEAGAYDRPVRVEFAG